MCSTVLHSRSSLPDILTERDCVTTQLLAARSLCTKLMDCRYSRPAAASATMAISCIVFGLSNQDVAITITLKGVADNFLQQLSNVHAARGNQECFEVSIHRQLV